MAYLRKGLLKGLVSGFLFCLLAMPVSGFAADKPKVITWNMHAAFPQAFWFVQAWQSFASEVARATKGELVITVYPAAGLGIQPGDVVTAVSNKLVPIAEIAASYAEGAVPEFKQLSLFYICKTISDHEKKVAAIRGDLEKLMFDKYNIKILAFNNGNPTDLYLNKEINSMEDFKGFKVRTMGPMMAAQAKAIGLVPMTIAPPEVPVALERKVIDGLYTTAFFDYAMKWYEYVTVINQVYLESGTFMIGVNDDAFNALPQHVQTKLVESAKWLEEKEWPRIRDTSRNLAMDALKGLGVTFHQPPPAVQNALRKLGISMAEETAAQFGEAGKDRLNRMLKAIGVQ